MTRRRPIATRSVAALALACAAGVLTACGSSAGGDVTPLSADDEQTSSATATPTPSASASGTASATGPQTYTSDLEDRAPVKVVRAWAAAVADEVNSRSGDHAQTRRLSTARGQRTLPSLYEEDYAYRYPGPLPLGPQQLVVSGGSATVTACVMTAGWGVERGTDAATSSQVYAQYTIGLRREGGAWKMDQMKGSGAQCSAADVKGSR